MFHYSAHPALQMTGINPPVFATDFDARQMAELGLDIWDYLDETGVAYRFRYQYDFRMSSLEAVLTNTRTYRNGYSEYTVPRKIRVEDIISEAWELPDRSTEANG